MISEERALRTSFLSSFPLVGRVCGCSARKAECVRLPLPLFLFSYQRKMVSDVTEEKATNTSMLVAWEIERNIVSTGRRRDGKREDKYFSIVTHLARGQGERHESGQSRPSVGEGQTCMCFSSPIGRAAIKLHSMLSSVGAKEARKAKAKNRYANSSPSSGPFGLCRIAFELFSNFPLSLVPL